MGQTEIKCIFDIENKNYMGQGFSGERFGPWAFCFCYVIKLQKSTIVSR
jgi:hypothetical protein